MLKSHINVGRTAIQSEDRRVGGGVAVKYHPLEANNTGTHWLSDGQDLFDEAKYRG